MRSGAATATCSSAVLLALVPGSLVPVGRRRRPGEPAGGPPGRHAEPTPDRGSPKPPPDTEAPHDPRPSGSRSSRPGGEVLLPAAAEDNSFVVVTEVAVDGEPVEEQVVAQGRGNGASEDYTWTAESGERDYEVVATDKAGNESEPATVTITIDADPPVVRRFEVTPGTATRPAEHGRARHRAGHDVRPDRRRREIAAGTTARQRARGDRGEPRPGRRPLPGRGRAQRRGRQHHRGLARARRRRRRPVPAGPADHRTHRPAAGRRDPRDAGRHRHPRGASAAAEETFEVADDGTARGAAATSTTASTTAPWSPSRTPTTRQGSAELTEFAVDTTLPGWSSRPSTASPRRAACAFEVTAEEGFEVDWRVLDTDGRVVTLGTFIASAVPEVIERDLDEGSYTVQVATSDIFDRTAEQEIDGRRRRRPALTADPGPRRAGPAGGAARAGAGGPAAVAPASGAAGRPGAPWARGWRPRTTGRPTSAPRRPGSPSTRTSPGWPPSRAATVPDDLELPDGLRARARGDRAVVRRGAPARRRRVSRTRTTLLVGERGSVVVTDRRLAFVGPTTARLVARRRRPGAPPRPRAHRAQPARRRRAGPGCPTTRQVTRQYLDLALARAQGTSYAGIVDRGLRDHELRRPTPPA